MTPIAPGPSPALLALKTCMTTPRPGCRCQRECHPKRTEVTVLRLTGVRLVSPESWPVPPDLDADFESSLCRWFTSSQRQLLHPEVLCPLFTGRKKKVSHEDRLPIFWS